MIDFCTGDQAGIDAAERLRIANRHIRVRIGSDEHAGFVTGNDAEWYGWLVVRLSCGAIVHVRTERGGC